MTINPLHYSRMFNALARIKKYQSPERLKRNCERDYGVRGDEAVEMAYENVLQEAKNGLRGVRKPSEQSS